MIWNKLFPSLDSVLLKSLLQNHPVENRAFSKYVGLPNDYQRCNWYFAFLKTELDRKDEMFLLEIVENVSRFIVQTNVVPFTLASVKGICWLKLIFAICFVN